MGERSQPFICHLRIAQAEVLQSRQSRDQFHLGVSHFWRVAGIEPLECLDAGGMSEAGGISLVIEQRKVFKRQVNEGGDGVTAVLLD